jgi:hypothetical protein
LKAKAFELRDRGTFVPALAIQLDPANKAERWLLRRAGFSLDAAEEKQILLGSVGGGPFHYDGFDVRGNSTRFTALKYIREHFDELEPGAVICTEHIRGERETPKTSERLEHPYA